MTTFGTDATRAALEGLRTRGVVADMDPVTLAEVLTGQADEYARACRERDAALARLSAIRRAVWPHLNHRGPLADLARTVNAKAIAPAKPTT